MTRAAVFAAALALVALYAFVGTRVAQPEVSLGYRLYYLEKATRVWNGGQVPEVQPGVAVDFTREQAILSRRGWGHAEPIGTWSVGPQAGMTMRVAGRVRPQRVVLHVVPFVVPEQGLHAQPLALRVNGQSVGHFELRAPQELSVEIPARSTPDPDGLLRLAFEFPRATSPHELGRSEDRRRLAVAVVRMTVTGPP